MYRSILVPLDGSSLSEYALPIACDIARRSGATLRLAHVRVHTTPIPIYVEGLPIIDQPLQSLGKARELTYLELVRDRIAEPGLSITVAVLDSFDTDVRDQTIPEILASYATATDTDLIVMTTHGRDGVVRFWLGSVASALLHVSSVPVVLVRPSEPIRRAEQPPMFRQILIPLDGSELAEQILEPARLLGDLTHAEYTLLHVLEPHTLLHARPFSTPIDFDVGGTRQHQISAEVYLDLVARPLREAGISVRTCVFPAERAPAAILGEARRRAVDLIAIATHGRSGLARLLRGSVADKILRGAEIPLLLYRPQALEERVGYQAVADTDEALQE